MNKTVISHFYNEEYLLPWWLSHHKKYFDHGIMIDYHSTDRSREIIREICPDWEIRTSRNPDFDAINCDAEVRDIELSITGWKSALNTTEFLIGNYQRLNDVPDQQLVVGSFVMVDHAEQEPVAQVTHDRLLWEQRTWGYTWDWAHTHGVGHRWGRSIHNTPTVTYPVQAGRHLFDINCTDLVILWYGYSPDTPEMWQRKMQIGQRTSQRDAQLGMGVHHKKTMQEHLADKAGYAKYCVDLTNRIQKLVELSDA